MDLPVTSKSSLLDVQTQSFVYSAPSEHLKAPSIRTEMPESNRFQSLLDSSLRRSQLDELVEGADGAFEGTEADPLFVATQVDSPMIIRTPVSSAAVDQAAYRADDDSCGVGLALGVSQSQQCVDGSEHQKLAEVTEDPTPGEELISKNNFIVPRALPAILTRLHASAAPSQSVEQEGTVTSALYLGISQSQHTSAQLLSPSRGETQPTQETTPSLAPILKSADIFEQEETSGGNNFNENVLKFGFTQSQVFLSDSTQPTASEQQDDPMKTSSALGAETEGLLAPLALGVSQSQHLSQSVTLERSQSNCNGDTSAQSQKSEGSVLIAKSTGSSLSISRRAEDSREPIVLESERIDDTINQRHPVSPPQTSPAVSFNTAGATVLGTALSSLQLSLSERLEHSSPEFLPAADDKVNGQLSILKELESKQFEKTDPNGGWMQSRRDSSSGSQPYMSTAIMDALSKGNSEEAVVSGQQEDIQAQLHMVIEALRRKDLEMQALVEQLEEQKKSIAELSHRPVRSAEKVSGVLDSIFDEPVGAKSASTPMVLPPAIRRAELTPLAAGLVSDRTPATMPQLLAQNAGHDTRDESSKRPSKFQRKKLGANNHSLQRRIGSGNFDFDEGSDDSDKAPKDSEDTPLIPRPDPTEKSSGLGGLNSPAARFLVPSSENCVKSASPSATMPQDEDDDDDTPLKDIIRRERKKKRIESTFSSRKEQSGELVTHGIAESESLKRKINSDITGESSSPTKVTKLLENTEGSKHLATSKAVVSGTLARTGLAGQSGGNASFRPTPPERADLAALEEAEWNSQMDYPPVRRAKIKAQTDSPVPEVADDEKSPYPASTKSMTPKSLVSNSPAGSNVNSISYRQLAIPSSLTELFNEGDIPSALFTSDYYNLEESRHLSDEELLLKWRRVPFFKVVWRELDHHGWRYKPGKELIDYFYIRPGRKIPTGFEGRDYYTKIDHVLEHIIKYEKMLIAVVPPPALVQSQTDEKHPAVDFPQPQESTFKEPSSADLIDIINRLEWRNLWSALMDIGWAWNYGTGLINTWYFRPGVSIQDKSAIAEVDKFSATEDVREYLRKLLVSDDGSSEHLRLKEAISAFAYVRGESDNEQGQETSKTSKKRSSATGKSDEYIWSGSKEADHAVKTNRPKSKKQRRSMKGKGSPDFDASVSTGLSRNSEAIEVDDVHNDAGENHSFCDGVSKFPTVVDVNLDETRQRIEEDDAPKQIIHRSPLKLYGSSSQTPPMERGERYKGAAGVSAPREASPKRDLFSDLRKDMGYHADRLISPYVGLRSESVVASEHQRDGRLRTRIRSPAAAGSESRHAQRQKFNVKYLTDKPSPIENTSMQQLFRSTDFSLGDTSSSSKHRSNPLRNAFKGISFIISGPNQEIKKQITGLVETSGGKILEDVRDIEACFENAKGGAPTVLAVGHPSGFRRMKYIMALVKGIPLIHYTWVVDCLSFLRNNSSMSWRDVSWDDYILPSGASCLHPYYIFSNELSSTGVLHPVVVLNLAGDLWDPILRAAGADLCSKFYPPGIWPGAHGSLCPHSVGSRAKRLDTLASLHGSGTNNVTVGERMNQLQMIDWYCCSCVMPLGGPAGNSHREAKGRLFNTPAAGPSKDGTPATFEVRAIKRPTLVLFDPYSIHERKCLPAGTVHMSSARAAVMPGVTPSMEHRRSVSTVSSIKSFTPGAPNVESEASIQLLKRLQMMNDTRLKFIPDTSDSCIKECPPRVVSIDWVTHVLQLGEYIDFNASHHFALPSDITSRPHCIKSADERYMVDDVVFYCVVSSALSSKPFSDSASGSTDSEGQLRMGRVVRFEYSDDIDVGNLKVRVRPLYFHKETLTSIAAESDYLRATVNDDGKGSGSDEENEDSSASSDNEIEEDFELRPEDNCSSHPYLMAFRSKVLLLQDELISPSQLCGRPVVISPKAYEDLVYPRLDETIYKSTPFYEACYSGHQYARYRRILNSLQKKIFTGEYPDAGGHYCQASQDF